MRSSRQFPSNPHGGLLPPTVLIMIILTAAWALQQSPAAQHRGFEDLGCSAPRPPLPWPWPSPRSSAGASKYWGGAHGWPASGGHRDSEPCAQQKGDVGCLLQEAHF
jgi:hypothetical protein